MSERCYRCGSKANQTWNICSDGNKDRFICNKCDIKLNEFVLKFMGFPDWQNKIIRYKKEMRACQE